MVFTYPPRNAISRLLIGLQNLTFKLRGNEFRVFVHAPSAMFGVLEERGLRLAHVHQPVVWQIAGFVRQT
jgi:magnesium-protoporphyrin O-methyltransferase